MAKFRLTDNEKEPFEYYLDEDVTFPYWQCKYCKEQFDKQDESQSWQLHKIGHKLTEIDDTLKLIASALRHEE